MIKNSWALFLGLALIMLGNGLQGSLLGVRAAIEGFGVTATGLMMSGYFIGLLAGSSLVPKMVARVGHVRAFGAMASLASTSILVHVVFIDPWLWWGMRFITGFAYAGLYIVVESWLNDASDNNTRGQMLSFYMLIAMGGMAGGQFMLNIANPSSYELFVLISVLVSFALVPILLSVSKAPDFETSESVGVLQVYRVSPLGIIGLVIQGITAGAIFGLGPVYAANLGMTVREISFFMAAIIIGGVVMQFPLGRMSDQIGRRKVIIVTGAAGVVFSVVAANYTGLGWELYVLMALVGCFTTPLYALCIAHTNDYLSPSQMVAASGSLVMASGIGASLGAPITAVAMDYVGENAFFYVIAVSLSLICVFGLWRSTQRHALPTEDISDFVVMAPTPMSANMNPELELEEVLAASDVDTEEMQESFEELVEELAEELTDHEPPTE